MDDEGAAIPVEQSSLRILRAHDRAAIPETLIAVQRQAVTSVHISVEFVGGSVIAFAYDTPSGNRPRTNANAVHLWPVSANSVPFNVTAETGAGIICNDPSGDQSLTSPISIGAYVVGYAVGPEAPETPETPDNGWSPYVNVIASAYIPPAANRGNPAGSRTSSIQTKYVGQNTLVFRYAFLAGFNPKAAKSWVGLWKGQVSPYASRPRWFAPIRQTNSTSDAALDGLQIAKGASYTLALFSSGFSETPKDLRLDRVASMVVFEGTT